MAWVKRNRLPMGLLLVLLALGLGFWYVAEALAQSLAFSGFYQDVRIMDGTNALGDLATRPLWVNPGNASSTLQASTVFATGTTTGTTTTGLGKYTSGIILVRCTAITGSPTANVYLQVSPDAGTTWTDYISSVAITATGSQYASFSAAHPVVGLTTPGTRPANDIIAVQDAALTAGSVRGGDFGDRIRVKVVVAGAATDATIVITGYFKG